MYCWRLIASQPWVLPLELSFDFRTWQCCQQLRKPIAARSRAFLHGGFEDGIAGLISSTDNCTLFAGMAV